MYCLLSYSGITSQTLIILLTGVCGCILIKRNEAAISLLWWGRGMPVTIQAVSASAS